MNLLSKELVSDEYRESLKSDLARASVCRFLVAYVSIDGLNYIGRTCYQLPFVTNVPSEWLHCLARVASNHSCVCKKRLAIPLGSD